MRLRESRLLQLPFPLTQQRAEGSSSCGRGGCTQENGRCGPRAHLAGAGAVLAPLLALALLLGGAHAAATPGRSSSPALQQKAPALGTSAPSAAVSSSSSSSKLAPAGAPVLAASVVPSICNTSLPQVVTAAQDLRLINMIQKASGVDFFQPYGNRSSRLYTVIAPSDRAIVKVLAGTSDREALERSFTSLLLYHQILDAGYNKYRIVRQDKLPTALGAALKKDYHLTPALDNTTRSGTDNATYMLIGMAPDNSAIIKRQHQACSAYMLVVDTMLLPVSDLKALPAMAGTKPFNASMWREVEAAVEAATADASYANTGSSDVAGDEDAAQASTPSSEPSSGGGGNSTGGGGGSSEGSGGSSATNTSSASGDGSGDGAAQDDQDTSQASGAGGDSSSIDGGGTSTTLILAAAGASVAAAAVATVGLFVAIRRSRLANLRKQEGKASDDAAVA